MTCKHLLAQDVVGINDTAVGWDLTLRLLRPVLLLGALHFYRFGYAIGTLDMQVQQQQPQSAEDAARDALKAQCGNFALVRRLLILHSGKLVALAVFWAAMQFPGALGWLLVAGLVATAPLLGGGRARDSQGRRLMTAALWAAGFLAAVWLVAQYAFQVSHAFLHSTCIRDGAVACRLMAGAGPGHIVHLPAGCLAAGVFGW